MPFASEKLVNYLHGLKFENLPEEVIEKAKLCILDTLGVALAGSITGLGKAARKFAKSIGGPEESTIYHYGDKLSCVPSAYANGTMSFCHNFTDTTLSCVIHCGPVIVPAALALCEKEQRTGQEFLLAVVAGYEMMTRVANVINSGSVRMKHHDRGFHATGTTGVFGASMAASKLMKLSPEMIYDAIGIAGSYASGILESITSPETEVWRSHTGIAAQNGITAACLANLGVKGPKTVLEGRNGFFRVFGGESTDLSKMEEGLGEGFLIMDSAFKLHNCAHVWAGPLDCLKVLIRENSTDPKDVMGIEVTVPSMYSTVMNSSEERRYPSSYAEAQNNPFYAMAAVVLHGGLYLEQYSKSVLKDPRMKSMSEKVSVRIDRSLDHVFQETDKAPSDVTIRVKDKGDLRMSLDYPRGSPQNPAGKEEIHDKFTDLAGVIMEKEQAKDIIGLIDKIDSIGDLKDLVLSLILVPQTGIKPTNKGDLK